MGTLRLVEYVTRGGFVVQTDMEEAKNQEITKLQSAVQEKLIQAQRANSQLTKELEDNKLALGQAAQVIKEVPPVEVFDAKVKKLTEDNEKLQVWRAEVAHDCCRLGPWGSCSAMWGRMLGRCRGDLRFLLGVALW